MSARCVRRGAPISGALWILVIFALLGTSAAGPRPFHRTPRHPWRQHWPGVQRVQFPSLSGRDTQRVQFPSLSGRDTQRIQFPSLSGRDTQRIQFPSLSGGDTQRIQFPSLSGGDTQRIQFPSLDDKDTQRIQFPSLSDKDTQRIEFPVVDAGQVTQRCASGFYRDWTGRCVPCVCNGLSDDCDESTGRCRNCQDNTAGDHCERCKDGYYGNAALRTCKICPCPLRLASNNFALGCTEVEGRFQCMCKTGYTGERCERCAPGYYGEPKMLGGRCRPCNCNGNSCSPTTGVCINGQDPKDTDTDQQCQECDNCAQTLLNELDRLESELSKMKAELDKINSSSSAYDRLKKLENAIADTKNVVNDYSAAVDRLSPKVTQLERNTLSLGGDIKLLIQKAENRSKDAQTGAENIEKTHKRAENLNVQVLDLLSKIKELLRLLKEKGNGTLPSGDVNKLLEEAERLVKEMQGRSLKAQKDEAVKELDEAQKLLEYVKNNCTKQYEQNVEAANQIKALLSNYEKKLRELKGALKEANETVQKANNQNDVNNKNLSSLLDKMKNLEQQRDNVSKDINVAKQQLNATEKLLEMLKDRKEEYEQLAAQLDGAKTELSNRVNNISQAAAKEGLVKKAEDHAALLKKLANELQEAVKNSSERADVQNALAAIDAYRNITEAVKAAEEAAKMAKDAADKALNGVTQGDVVNRAKDLKDKSNKLLTDAKKAENDLKQVTDDLSKQQKQLTDAGKKKDALEKELAAINTELNGIQRGDTDKLINSAKKTAALANAVANDTLDRLKVINDEVAKINATPSSSNIDGVLREVDAAVKNLNSSIPSLLDKIAQVESLSSQIDPNNNISNNINRIKELIEQARAAANRIAVPMKFTGDGYVELRPPKNLEDLRAYTALSLLLQRPNYTSRGDGSSGNLFILYFGSKDGTKDYLGLAVKNNVLYFIYKLNGRVYELETDSITLSDKEPSFFDKVDVQRIYQDVEVKLTKTFTSINPPDPTVYTKLGEPLQNLLSLNPDDVVFYVGGYPDSFTPPAALQFPKYQGCIELVTLNERFISLYNFKSLKPENITSKVPCKRYNSFTNDYLEGSGYLKANIAKMDMIQLISQLINSKAQNAVLMYFTSKTNFYCLTIEKGYLVMRGRDGDRLLESRSSDKQDLSGDKELKLIFQRSAKIILVRFNSVEVIRIEYNQDTYNSYYIGGLPKDLRERDNITAPPLRGCVKSLGVGNQSPAILERVGVGRSCNSDLLATRKAEFTVGDSLETPPNDFDLSKDMVLSLGFRSTEKDGLLLQNQQAPNGLELDMVDGFVRLTFQNSVWRSKNRYQDGEWHYLTVVKKDQNVDLRIDEDDVGEKFTETHPLTFNSGNIVLGKGTFKGCLSNLYMRRADSPYRPEDFSTFSASGNVLVDLCSATRSPENMWAGRNQTSTQDSKKKPEVDEGSACFVPSLVQHAFHLAGASSSLSYKVTSATLTNRPYFSLDVKTRSGEGLLFYIPAEQDNHHLALYVSRGRIRFSVEKGREIFNREKYNDGKWHTVALNVEKRRFRLVIDGLRAKDKPLSSSFQLFPPGESPALFLGTPPASTHKLLKRKLLPNHGIVGCIRNFKMNGAPVAAEAVKRGVGPCFEGQTQSGAYFSGHGAHVVVDEAFVVGQSFELVFELRPSKPSGLLLHVGEHNHLTVFMRRGEVVAQVNNGGGEFSVVVQPKQALCDGEFHRIAVIQRNNVVEMHVDTEGKYTIGPSSSSRTREPHPVYVGGVPDHLKSSLPVSESYAGCLQNIVINRNVVVLEKLSGVFGSVNLRECPVRWRPPHHGSRVKSVPQQ